MLQADWVNLLSKPGELFIELRQKGRQIQRQHKERQKQYKNKRLESATHGDGHGVKIQNEKISDCQTRRKDRLEK